MELQALRGYAAALKVWALKTVQDFLLEGRGLVWIMTVWDQKLPCNTVVALMSMISTNEMV